MSVRVNLLPRATKDAARAGRQRLLAGGLLLLLLLGLAAASLWQRGVLSDEEDLLADAELRLSAAQSEVNALAEYAELEQQLADAQAAIGTSLGGQVTLAGLLQDLSLVTPTDTALLSIQVNLDVPVLDEQGEVLSVGTISGQAEGVADHAPGVERFLLELDKLAGIHNVYLQSSTIDDEDVASFGFDAVLGPEYLTERYGQPVEDQLDAEVDG